MVLDLSNENSRSASPSYSIKGSQFNYADVTTPAAERPIPRSPSTVLQGMSMDVLERLARQVEYYFSDVNLEKDAYVSTLRSLNDGYVPLSIISTFGKVLMLAPQDSINAVRKAATEYSELLAIVHIDRRTGKRLDDRIVTSSLDSQTLEAVGPKTGEPIPLSSIQTHHSPPCASRPIAAAASVQNTVIIREVPEGTQDSHIRDLFTSDRCPPIQSIYLDVANCWFVTLDTTSKEEMVNVMLELRSKTFASGEPVKARLKSAVVLNADVSPVSFPLTNAASTLYAPLVHAGNKKSSHSSRKKKNSTNNKNKNSNAQGKASKGGKEEHDGNGDSSPRNINIVNSIHKPRVKKGGSPRQEPGSKPTKGSKQIAPTLGEDHFPALPNDDLMSKNKVEVEKLPEESMEDSNTKARRSSDSASTATTSSSSSSSKNNGSGQHSLGGYAAALLKPAPLVKATMTEKPTPLSHLEASLAKKVANNYGEKKVQSNQRSITSVPSTQNKQEKASEPMMKVQAPSWGGGRSFADVLRKESQSASAYQQSA